MKRNVLVIAGLAVLSTSAHATKSRMEALGQSSTRGSEYISDSRNIFRNPALLNSTKNYIVTEWGTTTAAQVTGNTSDDSATAPRAEGGFFREMGSFNYGLYLGNDGENNGRTQSGFLTQDNGLDLFLSGDMGVQWGAKLHYANSKDEATATPITKKNTAFGLGLGVVAGEAEGYLNLDLSDKSEGNTALAANQYKLKPSYLVGGSYKWSSVTFFASYEATKADSTIAAVTTTKKSSEISVGAGRIHEINPTARVITDAHVSIATYDNRLADGSTATGKTKVNKIPVTLGFEADAASWLVVRGNVHQNVILGETKNTAGKKVTNANSTTVDAGATLNFGKLKVDGSVGTTDSTGTAGTKSGVLSTSNLMTRVGVSYWF
ncbi:MAG: hypothetical protein PHY93_16390 [Bacteriovorax sp.]|nr:hypothetical protein [Bacteriovorax sp.]